MARKDKNKGFKTIVDEAVEDKIEEMKDKGEISSGEIEDLGSQIIPPESTPEPIKNLLSSFPSSQGYYGKIYKILGDGKWLTMPYTIESPEIIPGGDLEGEVTRLIRENKWGKGKYRIMIKRQDAKEIFLNKSVTISDFTEERTKHDNPISEGISIVRDVAEVVNQMKGPQSSPESMGDVVLRAVEAGRKMVPEPIKGNNGLDVLIEKFLPAIIPLISRPPFDENSIVEKVVAKIQSTLQPKDDFFANLIKYQEASAKINPQTRKENPLDSIRMVTDTAAALKPLLGGGTNEPPSILSLVLDKLPVLIEPLLTTFKEFAEAKKMEMQLRMDQYYGGGQPQIEGRKNLPVPRVHPFAARLIEVVNKNDESYFDMFRQQISRLYGQHVINGLVDGSMTGDLVIETLHTELGVPLSLKNTKPYIERFIKYLQGESEGGILAECKLCHEQYTFPDMKTWEADGKKCDCQGDLILVKQEGEA